MSNLASLQSDIAFGPGGRKRNLANNSFQENIASPALSNTYKVSLKLANSGKEKSAGANLDAWLTSAGVFQKTTPQRYDFLCAEAMIPGTTFSTYQEVGSRQGILESFPMRREYTDMAMSFYVSSDYQVLRLFQEWINFTNPVYYGDKGTPKSGQPAGYGDSKTNNSYHRFRYPAYYKREISIIKFERDIKQSIEYTFVNAFPVTLKSIPLSYQGAQILQVGVEFKYDRYYISHIGGGSLNGQEEGNFAPATTGLLDTNGAGTGGTETQTGGTLVNNTNPKTGTDKGATNT